MKNNQDFENYKILKAELLSVRNKIAEPVAKINDSISAILVKMTYFRASETKFQHCRIVLANLKIEKGYQKKH